MISESAILFAGETEVPDDHRKVNATWVFEKRDSRWMIAAYHNSPVLRPSSEACPIAARPAITEFRDGARCPAGRGLGGTAAEGVAGPNGPSGRIPNPSSEGY